MEQFISPHRLKSRVPPLIYYTLYKDFLSGGFRPKVKIVTTQLFPTPSYFCWQLAFYRQSASPNFGQAKHGQNGPAATFCQQVICCPICKHHFNRWTHPDICLRFRAGGQRVKKFSFSRICVAARDFFCRPAQF